jgi:hypothetical protein
LDVTFTVIVQVETGAILPLFSVTDVSPAPAFTVAPPPQPVSVGETGSAKKTFAGNGSDSEACVRVVFAELLVITIVNRLVPPAQIVPGLKLLLTDGF